MGLFDLFKRKPLGAASSGDTVWLTKSAKLRGISQAIDRSLGDQQGPDAILLVAHFADCLADLQALADDAGEGQPILVMSALSLEQSGSEKFAFDPAQSIEIIVGERHPLPERDRAVVEFVQRLSCRSRVAHHLSLDDALLRPFVLDRTLSLLKRLGMKEDEAIESRLVSRQLHAAQEKAAAACISNEPAASAAEWIERNCPSLQPKN